MYKIGKNYNTLERKEKISTNLKQENCELRIRLKILEDIISKGIENRVENVIEKSPVEKPSTTKVDIDYEEKIQRLVNDKIVMENVIQSMEYTINACDADVLYHKKMRAEAEMRCKEMEKKMEEIMPLKELIKTRNINMSDVRKDLDNQKKMKANIEKIREEAEKNREKEKALLSIIPKGKKK